MGKKEIILLTVAILGILALIVCLVIRFSANKNNPLVSPVVPENQQNSRFILPSPAPGGQYNILLLGNGGTGHSGGILTDSMMVIHLDTATNSASLIFIPRDLWVPNPQGKGNIKINEAYSKNGLKLAKDTVSNVTGLPIQYAIVIDFPSFVNLIDSLGGIDINVERTLDDYFYPITGKELDICGKSPEEVASLSAKLSGFELEKQFTCRYEHLHFTVGKMHIDGATALKFARSRHSGQDGSDFARGSRQQIILLGIKDKLLSLQALKNIDKIFISLVKFVKTDLNLSVVKPIAELIVNLQDYTITRIVPSDANVLTSSTGPGGQFILIPKAGNDNWREFQYFIKNKL